MDQRLRYVWTFQGNFIPRLLKADAIVLWPFVLFADEKPRLETVAHEFIHMKQIWRDTAVKFYLWYAIEYIVGRLDGKSHYESYRQISYELEAFSKQKEFAEELLKTDPDHYSQYL